MLIDVIIKVIEPPLKVVFKLYRMTDYRPKDDKPDPSERKLAA